MRSRLPLGKVPPHLLEEVVFRALGAPVPGVVVGPGYGEDAAVVDPGGRLVVVHSDPITAAGSLAGWLGVHVACNDVAAGGGRPRWLSVVLLLPEGAGEGFLRDIVGQVDRAAREVGVFVVGGHTEVAPGLSRPIVVVTALGVLAGPRPTPTSGVRPGDAIVMTKTAAVEGTAIMATDFRDLLLKRGVPVEVLERAERFMEMVSVVREAVALAEAGLVDAMHDPTEGGVLGGIAEMAYASRVRINVYEEEIPVAEETRVLAEALGVDPLRLISSGVLLAAVPREHVDEAIRLLEGLGVRATVVGEAVEGEGAYLVRESGRVEKLSRQVPDEIYKLAVMLGG